MKKETITFHERDYSVEVYQPIHSDPSVPRLIIPGYQPNDNAAEILDICIASIQQNTEHPYELWVVDNAAPDEFKNRLLEQSDYNVILNHTQPQIPERTWKQKLLRQRPFTGGSYANAIAVEIACAFIDNSTQYLMTLHMDTMATRIGWLKFLMSKLDHQTRASGVRLDEVRTKAGILHVLGMLFDFQLYQQLNLNFFPELPQYDVGDKVSYSICEAGYDLYHCDNTHWQPELIETIPEDSPYRHIKIDRSFDDDGNIIFVHLGRGSRKSMSESIKGTPFESWKKFAYDHVLKENT